MSLYSDFSDLPTFPFPETDPFSKREPLLV